MNDTNNNSINNTNIDNNEVSQVQSMPDMPQDNKQIPPATEPIKPEDNQATVSENKNDENQQEINKDNGSSEEKSDGEIIKKEFPYAVVFIGILLLAIGLAYYFFYITPTRVLDEAIEDIFDKIKSIESSVTNPKNETAQIDLKGKLRTAGRDHEGVKDIAFLDNLVVNAKIDADLKNLDFGASITSDVKDTTDMKYPFDINLAVDYIDNKFYLETENNVVKYTSSNDLESKISLNPGRISDAVYVFDEMKNQVIDFVKDEQLFRTITTKKVINQTAIAIKAHVKFDNKDIAEIYYTGFKNLLKDKDFIKRWANVFSLDEEEATIMLQGIYDRKVVTNNIEVNLYMNLANTELIGLDVTVDNFYIEINALNGYYYIDFKYLDDKGKEVLDIEVDYDLFDGVLNGVGKLNSSMNFNGLKISTGYLIVEFDYKRITADDSNSMIGNTLDFRFYDDDNGKPFATLDCTLDLAYDKEISIADTQSAVELINLDQEELNKLMKTSNKIVYEILFMVKKLAFNKVESMADEKLNEIEININNIIEKEIVKSVKAYLTQMPKEELYVLLNTPQAQIAFSKKISLLNKENQNDILLYIGQLKQNSSKNNN